MNRKFMWITVSIVVLGFVVLKALSLTGSTPVRNAEMRRLPSCPDSPNCVCSVDVDSVHAIEPISLTGDREEGWNRLITAVQAEGGRLVDDRGDGYARFEFRSRVFRFVDDLEILLPEEGLEVQVRSASRSGYSDFGVNRRRVEAIRQRFSEAW